MSTKKIFNFFLLFFSLVILVNILFGDKSFSKYNTQKKLINVLENNISSLEDEEQEYKSILKRYNNKNIDFQEILIKKELFLKSHDEKVILLD